MEIEITRSESEISVRTESEGQNMTVKYRSPSLFFQMMNAKTDEEIKEELFNLKKTEEDV